VAGAECAEFVGEIAEVRDTNKLPTSMGLALLNAAAADAKLVIRLIRSGDTVRLFNAGRSVFPRPDGG